MSIGQCSKRVTCFYRDDPPRRSRTREFVLGDATRAVLHETSRTVLLAH